MILRLVPYLACAAVGLGDALATAFGAILLERETAETGPELPQPLRRVTIDAILAAAGGAGALVTAHGRVGPVATFALAAATAFLTATVVRAAVQLLDDGASRR